MKPKVLVMSGYGINCEEETLFAFIKAGADGEIVHINDLISGDKKLEDFQILAFPGGFSYGDDTGSGYAFANKIKNNLWDDVKKFIENDKLVLGICNGFQILVNLGLLPAIGEKYGENQVALTHNNTARYECRWINLINTSSKCIFTKGIKKISLPVAHGEGKFFAPEETMKELENKDLIVFKYATAQGDLANGSFPSNPNGSLNDIAGICDETGRILGLMPHPERSIDFLQLENWTSLKNKDGKLLSKDGNGLQIFKNSVEYFK